MSFSSTANDENDKKKNKNLEDELSLIDQFKLKKRCLLLCALLLIFLLFSAIVLTFVFQNDDFCNTPDCIAAGRVLAASLNTSVDACENFFAYACGGWLAAHPLRKMGDDSYVPHETRHTVVTVAKERIKKTIRKIFESLAYSKHKKLLARSVQQEVDLYRECMNTSARDAQGLAPFKRLATELLGSTKWPALTEQDALPFLQSSLNNKQNFKEITGDRKLKLLLARFAKFAAVNIEPLIFVTMADELTKSFNSNTTANKVYFKTSYPRLLPNVAENDGGEFDQSIENFQERVFRFGRLFLEESKNEKENVSFYNNSAEQQILETRMKEVVEFAREIAIATKGRDTPTSSAPSPSHNSLYHFYLAKLASELKPLLPYDHFNSTALQLVVWHSTYYDRLWALLEQTPTLTIYNYLGLKLVEGLAGELSSKVTEIERWYYRAKGETEEEQLKRTTSPLWRDCLHRAQQGWAAARLYVEHSVRRETKDQATMLLNEMQKIFKKEVLSKTDWMDETTRKQAFQKFALTNFTVAYPEWLLDDAQLDAVAYHYPRVDFVKVQPGQYFENQLTVIRRKKAVSLLGLFTLEEKETNYKQPSKKQLKEQSEKLPTEVCVSHNLRMNSVAISAGLLQPPFFYLDPNVPYGLRYGTVGSLISHHTFHHFDQSGAQIDALGNRKVSWWTKETAKLFEKESQCFVDQYGSIVDQETGIGLKGKQTLEENIADNVALRTAFLALEARLKKDKEDKKKAQKKLPQLEQFTPEQLFFLAYAHKRCGRYRTLEDKKIVLNYEPYLPGNYRVNVPLSNLKQFSAAFHCPLGSKMNPIKYCQL